VAGRIVSDNAIIRGLTLWTLGPFLAKIFGDLPGLTLPCCYQAKKNKKEKAEMFHFKIV
jgi:hypothetical protein